MTLANSTFGLSFITCKMGGGPSPNSVLSAFPLLSPPPPHPRLVTQLANPPQYCQGRQGHPPVMEVLPGIPTLPSSPCGRIPFFHLNIPCHLCGQWEGDSPGVSLKASSPRGGRESFTPAQKGQQGPQLEVSSEWKKKMGPLGSVGPAFC